MDVTSNAYCPSCGAKTNPHKVDCSSCGVHLPDSVRNNPLYAKVSQDRPKAAVFDLDGTLFDNFQRFKDARRAGLVDDKGKAVQKGRQSMGAAWNKRNKFLYSKKNLAKDTVIPGAKELVDSLTNEGYVIVYLTARPKTYYTETLEQLESKGFPLYRDSTNRVMLITKPGGNKSAPDYKADEVRKLKGEFDVRMMFDDDLEVLSEVSKYDVPGLYSSVSDHIKVNPKVRRNGNHFGIAHEHRGETYVTGTDDMDIATDAMPDPDDPDGRTVGETSGKAGPITFEDIADEIEERQMSLEDYVKENPVKRGNDSKGGYYRWGKGKKYHYKVGSERSRNSARKKAYEQAKAAYAGGYRKNPANPKKVEKGKKLYKHMNGQNPEKVAVEKIDIGDVWYKVGEGGCWQIGYMSGKETGKEDQKYIHTFNEETKDGNFPELYATMPENGKPMLIIKGGTWKIRTDDTGVAWIYD